MQQLQNRTDSRVSCHRCARGLLTGVPSVMRFIRYQMRQHRQAELSVPQFRSLVFLSHNENASLSEMAEHLGLSLPATSRMVELLVKRGWMRRRTELSHARDARARHVEYDAARTPCDAAGLPRKPVEFAHDSSGRCRHLVAVLNVLESQRSLYVSQDAHVQSQSIAVTNLIALYKALGGGWEMEARHDSSGAKY